MAPRAHGKSSVLAINFPSWFARYTPGARILLLSGTELQAIQLLRRVVETLKVAEPKLLPKREGSENTSRSTNGSVIDVAGALSNIRGVHPELIRPR